MFKYLVLIIFTLTFAPTFASDHTVTNAPNLTSGELYGHCDTTFTETIVACDSLTWLNGVTYYASSTGDVFILIQACGTSTITLNLTVNFSNSAIDTINTCNEYTWIDGNTYYFSNYTATYNLINAAGCDSLVTLYLTITNTSIDSVSACDSYTWRNGVTYTASNYTARDTVVNATGCDSIITLDLIILANSSIHQITACDSFTWVNGTTYYMSNNTAVDTLVNDAGCDSIVALNLTISPSYSVIDTVHACNAYVWINGVLYTSDNNSAIHTLNTVGGCDSVVNLDLSIGYGTMGTDTHSVCDSLLWLDGNTYYTNNTTAMYTMSGGNANGCDSVITLNLMVIAETGTDVVSACISFTWIDGITYLSDNNFATHILVNPTGCDSVITLDLTILNPSFGIDSITACESYNWNGTTYTSSNNMATDTLINALGCDSIVTLDLAILNSSTSKDTISTCDSYTWMDGITYTSSTQGPMVTVTNSVGCDSVITLDLTIGLVDTSVVFQDLILAAKAQNATYRWLDCDNNYSVIPNETNALFTVTQSGNYAVEVAQNNCIDTSACFEFTNVGMVEMMLMGISIYPNPTRDFLHIDQGNNQNLDIVITNNVGAEVYRTFSRNQVTRVDMSQFASGIYVIRMQNQDGVKMEQVVKR